MVRIIDNEAVAQSRIRELVGVRDEALIERDKLLEPGDDTIRRRVELRNHAGRALDTLLEEGLTAGDWAAISKEECILVECEDSEPFLRRAPAKAVLIAPEWASAESIEKHASGIITSRFREPLTMVCAFSSLAFLMTLGGIFLLYLTFGPPGEAPAGPWAALIGMGVGFFILSSVAGWLTPRSAEEVLSDAPGLEDSGDDHDGHEIERADVEAHEGCPPTATEASTDRTIVAIDPRSPPLRSSLSVLADSAVASDQEAQPALSRAFGPGAAPGWEAGDDNREDASREGPRQDPDELQHYNDQDRRDRLNNIREEDLSEAFSYAYRRPENQARGSEAFRVVEARGELAGALGVSQGEALMEIAWRMEARASHGRSYLPYREVIAGTSLDPALPPEERVRPETRDDLHELIEAEKATSGLSPKVTYRIGPDREQFFNLPHRSEGRGEGYTLEDKLEYLQSRASELGFESHYTAEELERMDEIMLGEGYAPENEELLRFALVAGIDPRFFFEQASPGEDLRDLGRNPGRTLGRAAKKPGTAWLWRVEAAMSEAHGVPVEVFERKLIPWHVSRHGWMFR